MSEDEPDSFLRDVAASPAMSAPSRQITVLLVDRTGEARRIHEHGRSFDCSVVVLPDGTFCIAPEQNAGASQAAGCALALRDALPRARIALATGPTRAAAIDRATRLLTGKPADGVLLDVTTADLLDASFEVHDDAGARVLVRRRSTRAKAGRWKARAQLGAGMLVMWVVILVVGWIAASSRSFSEDATVGPCELLRDPSGSLTPTVAAAAAGWQSLGTSHPNLGFTHDVLWLRFQVVSQVDRKLDGVLDATREWVENVDLYPIEGGVIKSPAQSGARVPLARRPVPTERILFPLALDAKETRTFLLRIRSASPIAFTATILSRTQLELERSVDELLFGGYYAVLAGIAAYSLVLFWMLRDRTQLLVGLLLVGWCLVEATSHGHLSRLVPGLAGTVEICGGTAAFFLWTMSLLLLVIRVTVPTGTWARILVGSMWISWALIIPAIFVPTLYSLVYVGLLIALLGVLSAMFTCDRQDPGFLFFGWAVGALVVPGTLSMATAWGLVPSRPATEYGNHVGAVLMAILFSLLVGQAIRDQHASITSLNEELRRQIGDRARQLAAALARLSHIPADGFDPGMIVGDRYRVRRRIGAGGMGTVYEVERTRDGRRLALKTLKHVVDRAALARMAREAQIMAALNHRNIVSVLDVDVASTGTIFVVMELVEGPTLKKEQDHWGDGTWARPVLTQIAEALAAMHAQGIVHRDLKPDNVLVDGAIVKVADFGIASLRSPADGSGDSTVLQGLTLTGAIMGTPKYMAPELAGGARDAQPPADVWSFGVLAHELLTGKAPFVEPPILAHLERREVHATVTIGDDHLRALVARCLEHRPDARPSAEELVDALRA